MCIRDRYCYAAAAAYSQQQLRGAWASGPWVAGDRWLLNDSPLTDAWAPCHRPSSHRQQTFSNLSSPFSTTRAVTVGVIRIGMQLHMPAWQALVRSWLVQVRMESNPPSPLVRIWVNPPCCGRPLWTTPWGLTLVSCCMLISILVLFFWSPAHNGPCSASQAE